VGVVCPCDGSPNKYSRELEASTQLEAPVARRAPCKGSLDQRPLVLGVTGARLPAVQLHLLQVVRLVFLCLTFKCQQHALYHLVSYRFEDMLVQQRLKHGKDSLAGCQVQAGYHSVQNT
jgi:hypothetical protein